MPQARMENRCPLVNEKNIKKTVNEKPKKKTVQETEIPVKT
jgi:hypothetical protein